MTLDQWSDKYDKYIGNHINGSRYIPGYTSLPHSAYRELWTLIDYRVSTVSGGTVWLRVK